MFHFNDWLTSSWANFDAWFKKNFLHPDYRAFLKLNPCSGWGLPVWSWFSEIWDVCLSNIQESCKLGSKHYIQMPFFFLICCTWWAWKRFWYVLGYTREFFLNLNFPSLWIASSSSSLSRLQAFVWKTLCHPGRISLWDTCQLSSLHFNLLATCRNY